MVRLASAAVNTNINAVFWFPVASSMLVMLAQCQILARVRIAGVPASTSSVVIELAAFAAAVRANCPVIQVEPTNLAFVSS
jgi:hypothetical protein